jgi:Ni/Co efflux regulator RcnB
MRFEMRTVVRSFGTLAILLALVFVAGTAARAQGRHDRDRHDNGLHRGWYIGRHRGWDRNNNNAARRTALRSRLRYQRRTFNREERTERRALRRSDYNRTDRRAFNIQERQERAAFRARQRSERLRFRRNH